MGAAETGHRGTLEAPVTRLGYEASFSAWLNASHGPRPVRGPWP
ncbi:hypothetical protein [Lysobacter gummosus]